MTLGKYLIWQMLPVPLLARTWHSPFPCKLAAPYCKNLQEAWGFSLATEANITFHRVGQRCQESQLPRAIFSQWDQELEDKSLSSLVLRWDHSEVSSTVSQSSPGGLGPSCSQLPPSYYCFHSLPPLLHDDFCNHHFSFTTCIQISAQGLILKEAQPKSLNFRV